MLRKLSVCLLAIFVSVSLYAQSSLFDSHPDPEYKSYHWDEAPHLHDLTADEEKRNEVVIKDKRILEYAYNEHDSLVMYITHHYIVRVNSDKSIEENNTVYIPLGDGVKVVDVQARAISKEGKITNLDPKNVKNVDNYENLGPFRIFAIDGIELGSEVEYLYTVKRPYRISGEEYVRRTALHKDLCVDIYSPTYLVFLAKSYNGFPDVKVDSSMTTKRHIYAEGHDVEGFDHEEFSAEDGALMRLEYLIAYNKGRDADTRLYSYSDFCQRLFDLLNKTITKQDTKTAEKVVDTMKIKNLGDEDKIRYIESRLKNSIAIKEDVPDDKAMSLPDVFKDHVTSEYGALKLYNMIFDAAGIKYELVSTSDRFDKAFDGDFDTWTYLQKFVYYFPSTGDYIAPTEAAYRYGFIPFNWTCQKGFFMHSVTIGKDVQTGVGKVKDIPCNDYKKSMNVLNADCKFDFDMGVVNMHYKITTTGYEALAMAQPYYGYLSDQDRKDFSTKVFQGYFQDSKPTNIKVSGYDEKDILRNPFVVEADLSTNTVLEKTGNKYLFKIGQIIGPQSQLYRDTVRHTPIENQFNHGYHREISFQVPEGYKVTNLDAANMDVYDGKATDAHTLEFHSYYKIDGDKVTVYCDEYYSQLRYPISMYDVFRNVINASADFNKIVLVLEKK